MATAISCNMKSAWHIISVVKTFENIWSPSSNNILKSAYWFNMKNAARDISIIILYQCTQVWIVFRYIWINFNYFSLSHDYNWYLRRNWVCPLSTIIKPYFRSWLSWIINTIVFIRQKHWKWKSIFVKENDNYKFYWTILFFRGFGFFNFFLHSN
jgi:hypothetical protein